MNQNKLSFVILDLLFLYCFLLIFVNDFIYCLVTHCSSKRMCRIKYASTAQCAKTAEKNSILPQLKSMFLEMFLNLKFGGPEQVKKIQHSLIFVFEVML